MFIIIKKLCRLKIVYIIKLKYVYTHLQIHSLSYCISKCIFVFIVKN
jgi:hypothetical protein